MGVSYRSTSGEGENHRYFKYIFHLARKRNTYTSHDPPVGIICARGFFFRRKCGKEFPRIDTAEPEWVSEKRTRWKMSLTCGRFAAICLWSASRSFSTSVSFSSVSLNLSWVSLRLSISLSLSSNMETISCSKLASSPENCELLWLILSSEIVGITSHIIFHMFAIFP